MRRLSFDKIIDLRRHNLALCQVASYLHIDGHGCHATMVIVTMQNALATVTTLTLTTALLCTEPRPRVSRQQSQVMGAETHVNSYPSLVLTSTRRLDAWENLPENWTPGRGLKHVLSTTSPNRDPQLLWIRMARSSESQQKKDHGAQSLDSGDMTEDGCHLATLGYKQVLVRGFGFLRTVPPMSLRSPLSPQDARSLWLRKLILAPDVQSRAY